MSDDNLKEIENTETEKTTTQPEMLGVELVNQLASDGTPIATEIETRQVEKKEIQNIVPEVKSDNNQEVEQSESQEIIPPKEEPKVPPKEFDLEAQRDIVDQITDTYIPHPVGNSE